MKNGLVMCILLAFGVNSYAQHSIRVKVSSSDRNEPLVGATVSIDSLGRSLAADSVGIVVFDNLQSGLYKFTASYVNYQQFEAVVSVPYPDDSIFNIQLTAEEDDLEEEVVVTSTRTSRTISNTPTRTEVISGEELAEKGNMKPGDIRMLLSESTGIQVQQTSATSYNAGIRIQGLDGRYTQILRDGYPLYSGFAGGLSILQIAPLDLRQVEVIKGSSSTLYGGGAIAGLVNLISKTPGKKRELSFIANGTTAGGLDLSGFYSQRFQKVGMTIYVARNSTAAYDPADIGLTAIPKSNRITVNPRLFLYGKNTTADFGVSFITEDRIGGNVAYIKNGGSGYFEENNSDRITTTVGIAHRVSERSSVQLKNSYTRFNRLIVVPSSRFEAVQQSSFSEVTYSTKSEKAQWVVGTNFLTDDLAEKIVSAEGARDYHFNTYGIFIQNAWSPTESFTLESGLRGDYVSQYGFELLPRVSAMLRISPKVTSRIGGGFGYKTPTVFTEESERIQFRGVLPINQLVTRNERALGANWDVNYRATLGSVGFSFNHMIFYTRLNHPLVLIGAPGGKTEFRNSDGHIDTKGMETNVRVTFGDFKLFFGYTYTDANTHISNSKSWLPLTARHRLNNVLFYEIEDNLKLGLEAYYFSRQRLNDAATGKSYWITGFMAEKIWKSFSIYINFENFTNTRQTRFDTIYTGTIDNPVFRDIYAPVEGFVMNGGIKIRL
jgi:outer membrane receptor for ferrienterochelin and colicins